LLALYTFSSALATFWIDKMQVSEPQQDRVTRHLLEPEALSQEEQDRGIEFPVESLPYHIQDSALSELRSGRILIKNGVLDVDGRNTVPDYLRSKLYAVGSILFLPGLALTYYLIEQVSWIPASFQLEPDDILAYSTKDGFCIIAILYNRSGSETPSARRTLTFQLEPKHYQRVVPELAKLLPGKRTDDKLKAAIPAGSSIAVMGTIIWIAAIVANLIWRPW
jgi:hypothetical protein